MIGLDAINELITEPMAAWARITSDLLNTSEYCCSLR